MQAVTIFIPIYEAWKSKREIRSILSILEDWQKRRHAQSGADQPLTAGLHDSKSFQDSTSNASWTSSMRKSQMFAMESLEKALAVNPKPLLHYAATRDFTAENIVFLLQVRRWRAAWVVASGYAGSGSINAERPCSSLRDGRSDLHRKCEREDCRISDQRRGSDPKRSGCCLCTRCA